MPEKDRDDMILGSAHANLTSCLTMLHRYAEAEEVWYRVRKTWADAATQKGALHSLENAKRCADENEGYSVFDESGKVIYSSDTFTPYLVRVSIEDLNIRKGPGTDYDKTGKYTGKGAFTIVEEAEGKTVVLMGGGIGVPPILQLAKELEAEKQVVVGYRDSNLFLKDDLDKYATVYVATEDGSVGTKGNVMHAIEENALDAEVIFACGPMPMLRAIKKYAAENNIEAYISLEERMACGVGACLGCVCKTTQKDHHTNVNNTRICVEGPVFLAEEVEI